MTSFNKNLSLVCAEGARITFYQEHSARYAIQFFIFLKRNAFAEPDFRSNQSVNQTFATKFTMRTANSFFFLR